MSEPLTPPPPAPPGAGGPPALRPGLPWETSKGLGSLVETIKMLVTSPGRAFARARLRDDYLSPLLFALVLVLLGAIVGSFWSLALSGIGFGQPDFAELERQMGDVPDEWRPFVETFLEWSQRSAEPGSVLVSVLLGPLVVLIGLFVYSAFVHLGLKLAKGLRDSSSGFEGTFRAAGYSTVSFLAMVVPVIGWVIAWVWGLIVETLGLAELHRISRGKAFFAAIFPLLLCCLCCCIGFLASVGFGVLGAGMLGGN